MPQDSLADRINALGLDTLSSRIDSLGKTSLSGTSSQLLPGIDAEDIPDVGPAVELNERDAAFQIFKMNRKIEENKSFGQKAKEFGTSALSVLQSAKEKIPEFLEEGATLAVDDPERLAKSLIEGGARGAIGTLDLIKDIVGSTGDLFVDEAEELEREFERQRFDELTQRFIDKNSAINLLTGRLVEGFDESELSDVIVQGGEIVADPFNLVGLGAAGKVSKTLKTISKVSERVGAQKLSNVLQTGSKALEETSGVTDIPNRLIKSGLRKGTKGVLSATALPLKITSKAADQVANVVGLPRKGIQSVAQKLGINKGLSNLGVASIGASIDGGATLGALATEAGLKTTASSVNLMSDLATILSKPSTQIRFLERVATDTKLPKNVRRFASLAAASGATKAMDTAFDAIADGVSAGTIQSALSFAAQDLTAEQLGQQFGTGFAFGSTIGAVAGDRGAGKSQKAREDTQIRTFLGQKANALQIPEIKKLPQESKVLLAGLSDAGFRSDIQVLNNQDFKSVLSKELGDANIVLDNDIVPAVFTTSDGTIFVNNQPKNKSDIVTGITHEISERVARDIIGDDTIQGTNPALLQSIRNDIIDDNGVNVNFSFEGDQKISKEAAAVLNEHNRQNPDTKIESVNELAHKIVSEDIAQVIANNNFDLTNLSTKSRSINAATFKVLDSIFERIGLVSPETGAVLSNIPGFGRNSKVNRILQNHIKNKEALFDGKIKDLDSRKDIPLAKGQSASQRVSQLDPDAEIISASDFDPGVKSPASVTKKFFANITLFNLALGRRKAQENPLGRETLPGRNNNGQFINPLLLDNLNISNKGKRIINNITDSIQGFNKIKIWRKGKNSLKPDIDIVPYAFEINKQGGINIKAWDQNKVMRSIEELINKRDQLGSIDDVLNRINNARLRQAQGQPINDDLVKALLGGRPENIRNRDFRELAKEARGKRGAFITVPIKNIAGLRDLKEPGLGVRIKDLLSD